ncbi:hypothetical protein AAC387_Pa01g1821 [Persea americana]
MDSAEQKNAWFRARLKKREKRIDSPLVRYNDYDQPVCRVCDVVLKSESLWAAHQASRKHHEAIKNIKAVAAGATRVNDVKPDSSTALVDKPRTSSSLPADFFDNHEFKKPKTGLGSGSKTESVPHHTTAKSVDSSSSHYVEKKGEPHVVRLHSELPHSASETDDLASVHTAESKERSESNLSSQLGQPSRMDLSEVKQVKGVLPAGFFDNKDADLRARGIEPVKVDIKDEYKEFEKAIQEDLHEVDERLEEEEIDAAEMLEEAESVEQKAYRERVEMLKKMQMELKAAKSARAEKRTLAFKGEESSGDSSGGDEDDDDEENFTVDWRAQHL